MFVKITYLNGTQIRFAFGIIDDATDDFIILKSSRDKNKTRFVPIMNITDTVMNPDDYERGDSYE